MPLGALIGRAEKTSEHLKPRAPSSALAPVAESVVGFAQVPAGAPDPA